MRTGLHAGPDETGGASKRAAETPRVRLVVGLGNPGLRYAHTRHNLGFEVVECLAGRHRLAFTRRYRGRSARWATQAGEVVVLMPETFMNESGVSVAEARRALRLAPEEIVVVHDDLDLPLGRVRVRQQGSSGGHNGIRSIIAHLGTESFGRVRLGIGHPADGDVLAHVLSRFSPAEEALARESVDLAADAVEALVVAGFEAAMQVAHRPVPGRDSAADAPGPS